MSTTPRPQRRQFLAAASALALSPSLGARAARVRANDRLQLGVIGIGIRGRNLMRRDFLANQGFQVRAVCDVDTQRREDGLARVHAAYENDDCVGYVDYRELLQREDIDAVVIATPDHWHTQQLIDACAAGKHVYCEKPLTLTLREAQLSMQVAQRYGTVFQTGSQQRTEFGQRFVRAAEYVRNGRIGRVLNVNVGVGPPSGWCDLPAEEPEEGLDWDRWLGPAPMRAYNSVLSPRGVHNHYPQWRRYREYAGGGMADMGAHHYDIVQWALRRDQSGPVRVLPPHDRELQRGASLVYDDGVVLTHGGPSGATFVGTEGVIHVDRGRLSSVPNNLLEAELGEEDERLPRRDGHAADWLAAVNEGTALTCGAEVGARSVAVCHLMNIAYWYGRELTWDPASWRFVDVEEANDWLDYERREGYELRLD